ncbi:MAG: TIR domain-containing protein, partial [Pseudomonadota bacterium]|nr:TIR domain-containing protein [Pseudomonadota bacterium]
MTSIFLSHSTKDKEAAQRLKAWLETEERGHWVFLDDDLQSGILTGQDWEQVLYENRRQCRVFLPLYSANWAESKWCFAEMTHARAIGKLILPVKLERDFDSSRLFPDIQQTPIELDGPEDAGLARLDRALREEFPWDDPTRPPYPGLWAFKEEDAAIYKGRDPEVTELLEVLEGLRRGSGGTERFLLLLGASGSGKSSLVRAGVIPRLRRDPGWLVLPPLIPHTAPLAEFAESLARAFKQAGASRDFADLKARLEAGVAAKQNGGETLLNLLRELRIEAEASDQSSTLVVIDQAEEFFSEQVEARAQGLLGLLRAAMESAHGRLLVLATMRSEFLETFQRQPFLRDSAYGTPLAYKSIPLDPLPAERFPAIIRAPEQLTGLRIDADLVERMCRDTRTRDALPLLAYTLRRMWDNEAFRVDGRFELAEYLEIGGLEGSIVKAADEALAGVRDDPKRLPAVHAAFVPAMVRVTAEDAPVRRRARRAELPEGAWQALKSFVDNRLLMTDRDGGGKETIEVAHEALLRVWPKLAIWLEQDRDNLRQLGALQRAASDWAEAIEPGRSKELLIHRGERLQALETLVTEPRFALDPESIEASYLHACREAEDRREAQRQAEQERRIRDAEKVAEQQRLIAEEQARSAKRAEELAQKAQDLVAEKTRSEQRAQDLAAERQVSARRLQMVVGIVLFALVLTAGLAGYSYVKKVEAERQAELAQRGAYNVQLARVQDLWRHQPLLARNLLLDTQQCPVDLRDFTWGHFYGLVNKEKAIFDSGDVETIAFSPDGRTLATAGWDQTVKLWDVETRQERATLKGHTDPVMAVAFSPDGHTLASASRDRTIKLWDAETGRKRATLQGHADSVEGVAFAPDGRTLASVSRDETIRLWDAETGQERATLQGHSSGVFAVTFASDGRTLASASGDQTIKLWDAETRQERATLKGHADPVMAVAFSPDGRTLASAGDFANIILWDAETREKRATHVGHYLFPETLVAFSPDGRTLASAGRNRTINLRDAKTGQKRATLQGHTSPNINAIAFSPDGRTLAVGSAEGAIGLWDTDTRKERAHLSNSGTVYDVAFAPDGHTLASWDSDGTIELWDAETGRKRATLNGHTGLVSAVAPDGRTLVSVDTDGTMKLWGVETEQVHAVLQGHIGQVSAVAFSPDGRTLASVDTDGTIKLWDAETGRKRTTLNG